MARIMVFGWENGRSCGSHPGTGNDIAVLDIPSGRVTPFLNSQFDEEYPEFSPDGRWIAYTSDESNRTRSTSGPSPVRA